MGGAERQLSKTKVKKHHKVAWVDVENPTNEVFDRLEAKYHLHPLHLNESIQRIQLDRVEREDTYLFLLLHIPAKDPSADKIVIEQVGVFLGKNYLVTIHNGPSTLIAELFDLFARSQGHKKEYDTKGPGYLLYGIIKRLLDSLWEINQHILTELDQVETLVFDNNRSDAYKIGQVRQKIVRLRQIISSLRVTLDDLTEQINLFSGVHLSKYYSNNTKTANKLWQVIEEAKETIEIYKDADFTTSTEQTNQILAVLTLVFTFTIPITVVGTLYGMNVPVPGGIQTGAWKFLGRYTTFEMLIFISTGAAIGMYVYFKKKEWF